MSENVRKWGKIGAFAGVAAVILTAFIAFFGWVSAMAKDQANRATRPELIQTKQELQREIDQKIKERAASKADIAKINECLSGLKEQIKENKKDHKEAIREIKELILYSMPARKRKTWQKRSDP